MKMKALCSEKLKIENHIKLSLLVPDMREHIRSLIFMKSPDIIVAL